MTRVVLAVMPFAELCRPSAAVSLLQAILQREGLSCRALYGSLRFAGRLGVERYQRLGGGEWRIDGYGELVFSRCLFPDHPLDGALLGRLLQERPERALSRLAIDVEAADRFLDELVEAVLRMQPRILGCTSTFQQHLASLALLARVKGRAPGTVTMLGGANCEGDMGAATHRLFPQVDFVVSGEADGLLAPLCRSILERGPERAHLPEGVLGPAHRSTAGGEGLPRAVHLDLDDLPVPDFRDYFDQLQESGLASRVQVGLPVEASRGCWWGQRSHCTFCGLNGLGLAYRAKSPDRLLAELESLADRTGVHRILLVDNILDMRAFSTWLPRLAGSEKAWSLFGEVKSNLRPEHVRLLVAAGVRWVQPGIESLHTRLLALMGKGARAWQQVQLLKLGREHGLYLVWNLLTGFPGEGDEWHVEVARLLPSLYHLQPPASVTPIRFDRFSPYFERAEELGLDLEPHPLSALYHPFPEADRRALACHFQRRDRPLAGSHRTPGTQALMDAVLLWQRAFHPVPPTLSMRDRNGTLEVTDTRPGTGPLEREVQGLERAVLLTASEALMPEVLASRCAALLGWRPEGGELRKTLEGLEARRLVVGLDGRWLGLVLPEGLPALPPALGFPGLVLRADQAKDAGEDLFRELFGLPRTPR